VPVLIAVVIGGILAGPLAILLCALAGSILKRIEQATKCPACGTASLTCVTRLRTNPPTGTGSYYVCECCGVRWFRPMGKSWINASGAEYDGVFSSYADG
jgi:predicted RNA-binding Zn-ribbon protein involved in translation (DUF1610 family)